MEKDDKKYYLKCETFEGMFDSEKGVTFKDFEGNEINGFWPNEFIKENKLEVRVFEAGKKKSFIRGPFPDSGGYGFFQASCFYVNNDLLSCE